jgi:hypothetical protein
MLKPARGTPEWRERVVTYWANVRAKRQSQSNVWTLGYEGRGEHYAVELDCWGNEVRRIGPVRNRRLVFRIINGATKQHN